jgi:hypothetical protein
LTERNYGFQFSGIEYYTTFEKENCGFVRFDGRSKRIFYLDCYPGYSIKKDKYVIVEGEVPENNDLIEILSFETDKRPISTRNGFEYAITKTVHKWKKVDPQKIITRKPLPPEEFINYFTYPFISDSKYDTAKCLAMYAVSSYVQGYDGVGGIHSGVKIPDKKVTVLNRLLYGIPDEFRQKSSDRYYETTKQNKPLNYQGKSEVNINYLNPKSIYVHIPLFLNLEIKRKSDYLENLKHMEPLIQAQIRDAVLFKPDISESMKKYLVDRTYEMIEKYKDKSERGFYLDLSSTAAKVSTALARTEYGKKLTKSVIDDGVQTWIDNYDFATKRFGSNINVKEESRLSNDALMLYITLEDTYGIDDDIPLNEARIVSKMSEWEFEGAIAELRRKNAVICPDNYSIRLIHLTLNH